MTSHNIPLQEARSKEGLGLLPKAVLLPAMRSVLPFADYWSSLDPHRYDLRLCLRVQGRQPAPDEVETLHSGAHLLK